MTIHAILHEACSALNKSSNSLDNKIEARLLLQHVLNVNHAWLITHKDDQLDDKTHSLFQALLKRRVSGEPIAYILSEREFYGLPLKVTPDTLIPRPDTETLVEAALEKIPLDQPRKILDLGTGTGAIALAIAKHRPNTNIVAVDASDAVLTVAQDNANNLNINNITFIFSNWFDALQNQTFDIIVSNPPYIEQKDVHLSQGDLRFEPISALASGEDGLDDIRKIIQHAPSHLNKHGCLMLEHGYNQAAAVSNLLKKTDFTEIRSVLDLAGIQRVTIGQL
jgi:release factor glutamine methyltransferase